MKTTPLRSTWPDRLKSIACALAVMLPFGASAVLAASEALQPAPGNAMAVLCGAVGRCQGTRNPAHNKL